MKRLLTAVAAGILGLAGCKGVDTPNPNTPLSVKGSASGQVQTPGGSAAGSFQTNGYRPGAGAVQQTGGMMQAGGTMQTGGMMPAGGMTQTTTAGVVQAGGANPMSCQGGNCRDCQLVPGGPMQPGAPVQADMYPQFPPKPPTR